MEKKITVKTVNQIVKKVVTRKVVEVSKYPSFEDKNGSKHANLSRAMNADGYENMASIKSNDYIIIKNIGPGQELRFEFAVNATEHTCGFLELGDLGITDSTRNFKEVAQLLDEIVECSGGYTLFMNTNGKTAASILLEKALPFSKHWAHIKKYNNPNSKNTLTLWVTNN